MIIELPHGKVGLGRIHAPDQRDQRYPMRAVLPEQPEEIPYTKTWRLDRSKMLDQGDVPQCVAYTGKHWELANPICYTKGKTPQEYYTLCKQIDGYPDLDGTDAHALLKVMQQEGKVKNYYWYTGDISELEIWALTKGAIWLGVYLSESFFTPDEEGYVEVGEPDMRLGHEMLLKGYNRNADLWKIANSWGLAYGDRGCVYVSGEGLKKLLDANGDACGVVEIL